MMRRWEGTDEELDELIASAKEVTMWQATKEVWAWVWDAIRPTKTRVKREGLGILAVLLMGFSLLLSTGLQHTFMVGFVVAFMILQMFFRAMDTELIESSQRQTADAIRLLNQSREIITNLREQNRLLRATRGYDGPSLN